VAVCPAWTVTARTFRPCSGCTKTTVCDPGDTDTPTFGVCPRGRPSRITVETGIELMLSVPLELDDAWDGAEEV